MNNEIFEVTQNYQTKELFNLYYRNLVAKYNELNKKRLINHLKKYQNIKINKWMYLKIFGVFR